MKRQNTELEGFITRSLFSAGACAAVWVGVCAGAPLVCAADVEYELFIIEPFVAGGTAEAAAYAVNNSGQATGFATNPNQRPYIWDAVNGKQDLGTAMPAIGSSGYDINSAGVVVGEAGSVATIWYGINNFQSIPAPSGAFFPFAFGVNDSNMVVGRANLAANITTGFVWDSVNGSRDLRNLGVTNAWNAAKINGSNQIIGQRLIANLVAYRFDMNSSALTTLGTLGGPQSEPLGINSAGHVVGWANNANFNIRAFRWTPKTGMQDLGSLDGQPFTVSRAFDINDSEAAVGISNDASGSGKAFIWDAASGMRDLNTLVDAPNFQLIVAKRISNTGWIAGDGRFASGGLPRGFVLKPIEKKQPCVPADLNCDDMVNVDDLVLLLAAWGDCPAKGACDADIAPPPDGDGQVNVDDLVMLLANWG